MFGYVRARRDTMPEGAWEDYEAVYCGLCHTMGKRYGDISRLFLNYDFTFLAMLLAPGDAPGVSGSRRCLRHPVEGRPSCEGGPWLETAAAESVILTWWKLRDGVNDEEGLARVQASALSLGLRGAYQRAKGDCPDFDRQVSTLLAELNNLEGERCPSIDRTADCFARLLRAASPKMGDGARDRAMAELLYHLGRWIYLVDAVDDLAEDTAAGRYNPVSARFPQWTEEDKAYLRNTMDHSLGLAGAAFQLLPVNPWSRVVENILYSGLPGVEELVFSGKWQETQKRHRRNDP